MGVVVDYDPFGAGGLPSDKSEEEIAAEGARKRSSGVANNGMLPGGQGQLDRLTAGKNWATYGISEDGNNTTIVLPTKPGDYPANDATGFRGTAVERYLKDPKRLHYGKFETDEAGAAYMNQPTTLPNSPLPAKAQPKDPNSRLVDYNPFLVPTDGDGGASKDKSGWWNIPAGLAEAYTGTAGFVAGSGPQGSLDAIFGLPQRDLGGQTTHALNKGLGAVTGFNPEDVSSDTFGEKILRMSSTFVAPGMGLEGSLLSRGGKAVAAGTTAAGAEEIAPDELKPFAALVGGLFGLTAPALVTKGAKIAASSTIASGFSKSAAKNATAKILRTNATDPDAVEATLNRAPPPGTPPGASWSPDIVPGSPATTAQLTEDAGLLSKERAVSQKNPVPYQEIKEKQNRAQINLLSSIEQSGNPIDATEHVQSRIDDFNKQTADDALGLLTEAKTKADAAQLTGAPVAPEAHGEAVREALDAADKGARAREETFWQAVVKPDPDMTGNATATVTGAKKIAKEVRPYQSQMAGKEKELFEQASNLEPLEKVQNLIDLRSEVSTAMREELASNGNSLSYRRLSQLRGILEGNLSKTLGEEIASGSETGRGIAEELRGVDKTSPQDVSSTPEINPQQSAAKAAAGHEADVNATFTQAAKDNAEGKPALTPSPKPPKPPEGLPKNATPQDRADYKSALETIRAARSPQSLGQTVLQAIRKLGGFRTRSATGKPLVGGLELEAMLKGKKLGALVNNKWGMAPDNIRESLQENGWFNGDRSTPTDLKDLHDLVEPEIAGRSKVYHPEAGGGAADRALLDEELGRAGVTSRDSPGVAARKLMDFRRKGMESLTPEGGADVNTEGSSDAGKIPTADVGLIDRLKAATAATRERARTFRLGPVGQVLRRAGMQDLFRLREAQVPGKFFHPGPSGYQDVQSLYKAIGRPQGEKLMTDYATDSLRRAAMKEDGTLDPGKFERWKKAHSESLRALPDAVRAKFQNAADAAEVMADTAAVRAEEIKAMEKSSVRHILGAASNEDATRMIGKIFGRKDAVATMRALAADVRGNPAARAGLRQGIIDHMMGKFIANKEVGVSGLGEIKSDQFQTFLKNNRAALREVFTGEELANMERVAMDLKRSKLSETATKLPHGSNTPQDLAAAKRGPQPSNFIWLKDMIAGTVARHTLGAGTWLYGAGAAHIFQEMRNLGINRIDQLVDEALRNPEFARQLFDRPLGKVPGPVFVKALRKAFRPASLAAIASSQQGGGGPSGPTYFPSQKIASQEIAGPDSAANGGNPYGGTEHLTPAQKLQFRQLGELFDPDISKGNRSPLSKLGAMIAREKGTDVFKQFTTPLNALGMTFVGNTDPAKMSRVDKQLFKEMRLDPTKSRGHIGLGPEAMAAKSQGGGTDTVYHELIHYALDDARQNGGGYDRPWLPSEDLAIPLILLKAGIDTKGNEERIRLMYPQKPVAEWQRIFGPLIEVAEKQAATLLKERYGKRKK